MITLLDTAKEAVAALSPGQRLMGLDLGTKTIGVAFSDATRRIATPRSTIARSKFNADAAALITMIKAENVGLIVMGLPLNMNGTEGPRSQSTRAFARNFAKLDATPLVYWDERLSTAAVNRAMLEGDLSRAKRAVRVDMMAAAYILQSLLDGTAGWELG
jgi:putative holliday junction resolvase